MHSGGIHFYMNYSASLKLTRAAQIANIIKK